MQWPSHACKVLRGASARYAVVRSALAGGAPDADGGRRMGAREARWVLAEHLGGGSHDHVVASLYHDLLRGPLRALDDGYMDRMREALLEAVQRGSLVVFERRRPQLALVGDKVEAPTARSAAPEKAHELVFVVTCEATGKPLPNAPYAVYDENQDLVATGKTNRSGEARCDVGVPGQYGVVAFPNRRERVQFALVDENGDAITNTEVTLEDSEGKRHEIVTSSAGVASCDDLACGRVTITVGDKTARVYFDSEHRNVRRVRIRDYFVDPPEWDEFANYEPPPNDDDED